ncbi:MAG: NADH-quinone oxidoreductase subunit D [Thermoprotei archaeon]|nr:MAG: NADH-quinone oxidoreductase subunit D [Thermoprotei archaeon]
MSYAVDLLFGPQHPALHEPERFRFKVDGEIIVDVDVKIGYIHRGIEKLAETKNFIQNIYLTERICGICNVAHTLCYVQAVEDMAGIEVPERAKYLRVIVHELNRIHSHLLILGVAAELLGWETEFMYLWRDREAIMDIIEDVTGNRVTSAFNTIGGVRRDINDTQKEKILKILDKVEKDTKFHKKVLEEDPLYRERMVDIGILKPRDAIERCAVGPTARGSGVDYDVRAHDPYAAFDEIPFNVITYKECDSWARMMVRVDETLESINIIRYALKHLPQGDIRVRVPARLPAGEGVSRVEAPRGELLHHVFCKGDVKPYRLKVRTPTFANILAIAPTFIGHTIADVPAILVSIDPCFSCTDRLTFIDVSSGKVMKLSLEEIKKKYWRR